MRGRPSACRFSRFSQGHHTSAVNFVYIRWICLWRWMAVDTEGDMKPCRILNCASSLSAGRCGGGWAAKSIYSAAVASCHVWTPRTHETHSLTLLILYVRYVVFIDTKRMVRKGWNYVQKERERRDISLSKGKTRRTFYPRFGTKWGRTLGVKNINIRNGQHGYSCYAF